MLKEIKSLTGLRGLAALWVAIVHSGLYSIHGSMAKYHTLEKFVQAGNIAVDIFFMLSGYILMNAYKNKFKTFTFKNFGEFIIKRFARIYPIYIVWLIIIVALCSMHLIPTNVLFTSTQFSYFDLFSNLLLLQNITHSPSIIGVSWSLSDEWIMYFVFPAIMLFIKRFSKASIFLYVIMFFAFRAIDLYCISLPMTFQNILHFNTGLTGTGISSFTRSLTSFILGMLLYQWKDNLAKLKLYRFSLFFMITLAVLSCVYKIETIWFFCIFIINPLILLSINEGIGVGARILSNKYIYNFGLYSYSFYLIHGFFMDQFKDFIYFIFKKLPILNYLAAPVSFIFTVLLVAFISKLAYNYIEIPGKKTVSNFFHKKNILTNRHIQHIIFLTILLI